MGFFGGLKDDARRMVTPDAWGFSWSEYGTVLKQYPTLLGKRAFMRRSAEEMEQDAESAGALERTMGPLGLTCVGVGLMLGAGIFIAPGTIAVDYTGPAVCVAYVIAAVSAYLSCFCYAEFAVDMPLAGAAYNYIAASLGEFLAWVVTSNLLFEYVLADAAVIRGFAPYFATLIGQESDFFLYEWNGYVMDWWAFGITLVVTFVLSFGAKESTTANTVITIIHVIVMIFIIIAGFTQGNSDNLKPFFLNDHPQEWKQVFNGAAIAFFSFIGFDAVATAAEEVQNPSRDMPIGILGSMSIVTVIYVLMCVVLCYMVPTADIDPDATFSAAFKYVGLDWAVYIVSLGAVLGIITGIIIGIYAPARILCGACREGMLPPFLSWVGPKQTPWVATWVIGITVAGIALFTGFDDLANMVSIGTFIVFWFVALALMWRRTHVPTVTSKWHMVSLVLHLTAMIGFSLGFVLVWTLPEFNYGADDTKNSKTDDQWIYLVALGSCCVVTPFSMFFFCKPVYVPQGYKCPLYPFVPCASIFVNTFLLGQLDEHSYKRFGYWTAAVAGIYLLYGLAASYTKDAKSGHLEHSPDTSESGKAKAVAGEVGLAPMKM